MKTRVLCFGDSNTWGYIPISGNRYDETIRWPARLQEMLGYENYTVIEEGLTGRTTAFDDPFDPNLNGYKFMPAILRTAAPVDIMIFMLGTNDFQSYIPEGNPISTARAIQFMLQEARKLSVSRPGNEMKILLISPIEISEDRLSFKDNDATDQVSINNSRKLGEHLKIVAQQECVDFINAAEYIKPGRIDGTHLDKHGHAQMAQIVYEKLIDMMK